VLRSILAIPLGQRERTFGVILLGNAPQGYSLEVCAIIEVIAAALSSALDRIRNERELRQNAGILRALVDCSPLPLLAIDRECKVIAWSPAAESLLGWTPEEVMGQPLPLVPPGNEEEFAALQELLRCGVSFLNREVLRQKKDGTQFWASLSASPLYSAEGQTAGAVAVLEEITERKRAEDALREREELYRALIEGIPDVVMRFDRECRHLFVSPNTEETTGIPVEKWLGKSHADLGYPPEMCQYWEERIRQVFKTGMPFEAEFSTALQGQERTFNWRMLPEFGPQGELNSVLSISRDITAQRTVERDYQTLFREMREGLAVHEVICDAQGKPVDYRFLDVNPAFETLTGLKREAVLGRTVKKVLPGVERLVDRGDGPRGAARRGHRARLQQPADRRDRLQRGAARAARPGDALRQTAEEIRDAAERAAGLTRQLLEEMRPMLQRLVGEAVEVRVDLAPGELIVHADLHQIQQVVMNLAVNARDAMSEGGTLLLECGRLVVDELYVRDHSGAKPGHYAALTVSDTGAGMSKEVQERIFEPFFTTKAQGEGTGLGLAMVQGIVMQSGGFVNVYSEPGSRALGLRFTCRWHVHPAACAPRRSGETARGGCETVLVVEDQAEVRGYAVAVLKSYGYRVLEAENAGIALMMFEQQGGTVDLVMTDLIMPRIIGAELAERLWRLRPDIPILYTSGYPHVVAEESQLVGPNSAFIQKPFRPDDLARHVRALLDPGKAAEKARFPSLPV
jgi:two-component system, cell cycle sensor histidine kinase and response regulator CckA